MSMAQSAISVLVQEETAYASALPRFQASLIDQGVLDDKEAAAPLRTAHALHDLWVVSIGLLMMRLLKMWAQILRLPAFKKNISFGDEHRGFL